MNQLTAVEGGETPREARERKTVAAEEQLGMVGGQCSLVSPRAI